MALVQAQDFMKEFNFHITNYLKCNTMETEGLLNGRLTMILASEDSDICNCDLPPTWSFYHNLYKVISIAETNSQIFWSAIAILNKVVKLDAARTNILKRIDYVSILSNHLGSITNLEKKVTLLFVLKELTYSIEIDWEKPYLDNFINGLLKLILASDENENVQVLALTVLVNLCHRNIQPTFILLTKIPTITNFLTQIKAHSLLAAKMLLILGEHNYSLKPIDFHNIIKLILNDIEKAVNSSDAALLQHSVEFLMDMKRDQMISVEYIEFESFRKYIDNLLKIVDDIFTLNSDNSNACKASILEFFGVIVDLEAIIKEFLPHILKFALKCLKTDRCVANALVLIQNISLTIVFDATHKPLLDTIDSVMRETIELSTSEQFSCEKRIGLYRVMSVLINNTNLQCGILTLANTSYFAKVFDKIVSIEPSNLKFVQITLNDLRQYIHAINVMSVFSEISPMDFLGSIVNLLKKTQIHYVLAKGLYSGEEDLIKIIMYLMSKNGFPHAEVAHVMSDLHFNTYKNIERTAAVPVPAPVSTVPRDDRVNLMNNYYVFRKQIENRLNDMIEYFNDKINKGEIKDMNLTEVIQFHQNKIYMLQTQINNLKKNLQLAQENEVQFEYGMGYQKAEINYYQQENFAMHLSREKSHMELEQIRHELDSYKNAYHGLQTKLETQKRDYDRVMVQQTNEYKLKLANLGEKITALEDQNQEYRKELLEARENLLKMAEAKEDNLKLSKEIAQMKIERANLIHELSDKNNSIETLEREIKDVEDMRQTIMSLMQPRKPLSKR